MIQPYDKWTEMSYEDWLTYLHSISDSDFRNAFRSDRVEIITHLDRFMCGHLSVEWISHKLSGPIVTARRKRLNKHLNRFSKIQDEA